MATFSDEEIAVVIGRFPGLRRAGAGALEGVLSFSATYGGNQIEEEFDVRILAPTATSQYLPELHETGGRTKAIAEKWKLADLRALHRNPGGSACVCVRQEEQTKFPLGSGLIVFVDTLVVPYLYGLAFFDREGRWPWGERSHGSLGLLEFYADCPDVSPTRTALLEVLGLLRQEPNWKEYHKQIRRPSGQKRCLCGSGRPFETCHRQAFLGVRALHDELVRAGIRPRGCLEARPKVAVAASDMAGARRDSLKVLR